MARKPREVKLTPNMIWAKKFEEMVALYHKRNFAARAQYLMKKSIWLVASIRQRSKKQGVAAPITLEQMRQLILDNYGKNCKYLDRPMVDDKYQIDHIVPISKGGDSSIENLQMISAVANKIKGSLTEEEFLILMAWLKTLPQEMADNISIRLAGGKR